MENRAARVWARIGNELAPASDASSSVEQIRNCEDYRALIPDFIAGRLSQARALLLRDHTHECVACRNALNQARGETPRSNVVRAQHRFNRPAALVVIAASLIAAIALQQTGYLNWLLPVMKVHAVARTIDGKLYRIARDTYMNPVSAGDRSSRATGSDRRRITRDYRTRGRHACRNARALAGVIDWRPRWDPHQSGPRQRHCAGRETTQRTSLRRNRRLHRVCRRHSFCCQQRREGLARLGSRRRSSCFAGVGSARGRSFRDSR